ncbi:histidine phosphatase family protein [Bombilactobacillus folatiphilus]|uniref:Histidine phosphatase family protein n=1 Tax=Bombilactobacillus folatiphilus TaxID=2923362 RepID=A0ABY4PAY6_9LACO|nr:histidine phosphatase family protein [Bombilactobacillus folatiphilus]UQS82719.1 histidine phosphatase family protein [Bombilactobacillus folatiphilus]
MTQFYFVRHGKTQWNFEGRYQGSNGDSPLLPSSYRDIGLLANYLTDQKIDHIYTSPIKRAYITAKTLADDLGGDIPISKISALREFDLGILEGQKFVLAEEKYPQLIWAFRHDPSQYNPDIIQGETFDQVIRRTNEFIKQLAQADDSGQKTYLIVSHGAALVAMIKSLLGVPLAQMRKEGGMSNTGLTILQTSNHGQTFELLKWNDTSYLRRNLDITDTI